MKTKISDERIPLLEQCEFMFVTQYVGGTLAFQTGLSATW